VADTGLPWELPYPLPTDLVRDGADDIKALAEATATGLSAAGNAGIGSNVVTAFKTDTFSTSSTSLTNVTGLEVTITPSSDTSKVLLIASFGVGHSTNQLSYFDFAEGTTSILVAAANTPHTMNVLVDNLSRVSPVTIHGLHAPGVATPVTYRVRCRTDAGTVYVGRPGTDNVRNVASMLTAIEVAA
jgi:hypothetical protein